jgi:membrane protease YdiL (CAAX protease family)
MGLPGDPRPHQRLIELAEDQREHPTLLGFAKLIGRMVSWPLRTTTGQLLASAVVLIVLWGRNGELPWIRYLWSGWKPFTEHPAARPRVISGLAWDQEWIAFAAGFVLLVAVPCVLIKVVFHHDLKDYGLGLPDRRRARLAAFSAAVLVAMSIAPFLIATGDSAMKRTYPLYHGSLNGWNFVAYELGYLAFFIAIEFMFRGYLLLGLFRVLDRDAPSQGAGERGPLLFGFYALFISMLSYTAWHLGKPMPELAGTLVWGPVAGSVVLLTRSIWPVVVVHWVLNVVLDALLR